MIGLSRERWEALRPLLDEALELDPEARTGWLDTQRQSNPTLAAEVEALLAREDALDREGFLDPASGVTQVFGGTSLEGKSLGPWLLERQIGQGGMGSVWLARRNDGRFEGNAAIKFLSLAVAGASGEARFRREGSVLARLSHPNIAKLLDAGVSPAGQPYLVLEHVDGTPLDQWCGTHHLDVEARLRLFQQVLDAVAHAHASLIVHRDLKPANILVTSEGRVKLLDFGIAKLLEEGGDGALTTGTAERLLTLEYAAPEQIRAESISTATDVYSLGVVLYKLLTGVHPTSPRALTVADQIRGILETEPARLPGHLAGDLDNILARALRKDPAERYQSVAALAADLAHYLNHEPVSARPATWAYRAGKFVRRHRGGVITAALVTVALIISTGSAVRQGQAARRERDQALKSLQRQLAMNSIQEVLAADLRGADGRPLTSAERLRMAATMVAAKYRTQPWLASEGITNLSTRFYETGDLAGERTMLAQSQAIARENNLPDQLALADCERVYTFAYDEKYDSAATELAEAKRALAGLSSKSEEVAVVCMDAEGQLLAAQEKYDAAIPLLRQATERTAVTPEAGSNASNFHLQALNDYSNALRGAGRTREAAEIQRRIVAELLNTGYGLTDQVPAAMGYLTSSLLELGEFAALDSALRPRLKEAESALGVGHAAASIEFYHGTNQLRMGQLDSADLWLARSVHDDPSSKDANSGARVWAPATLTELRLVEGRVADARREAEHIAVGTFAREIYNQWLRAWIRVGSGDTVSGSRQIEEAMRRFDAQSPHNPRMTMPLLSAAEWRLARGDWHVADSLANEARSCAAVDSLAYSRSGHVGRAELIRARALLGLSDTAGARDAARRAVVALTNGYGADSPRAQGARALADSLARLN